MKRFYASFVIAFSTYSRLPMPQVAWSEANMRHTLSFFPLVGAVLGLLFYGAARLCALLDFGPSAAAAVLAARICALLNLGPVLTAAVLTALPVLLTGDIHLDGYCDTIDALSSHASREKKLQILKDSNAGAFAVIWCCVWFALYFGLLTELQSTAAAAAGFLLSRAFSALAVARLPSARAGMGASLKSGSRYPLWVFLVYLLIFLAVSWLTGALLPGCAAMFSTIIFYFVYKSIALREFGGFTGDLAGWFPVYPPRPDPGQPGAPLHRLHGSAPLPRGPGGSGWPSAASS